MTRTVNCVVLKREAEAMEQPPHPGELGQRIFENVSQEGWDKWLERLVMIINENGLSTADENHRDVIERHMLGYFFGEGDFGQVPAGFKSGGGKK